MNAQACMRVLHERWWLIFVTALLALAISGGTWYVRPPEYTASLRMYVSAQSADTAQSAFQGAQLSQQRVTSYVELLSSTRVSDEVIRQIHLNSTPDELAKHITATSKLDSVILDVTVTGQSPEAIAAIANAVGVVFPRLVDELERPSSPTGTSPVAVRVIEPASAPSKPSSLGLGTVLTLGLLAGLAVGIAAAFLRNALDTSVRSPEELSKLAQAPNLGTIAFDPAVPKRPLIVHQDPQSPRAEAFRQLRTNLQFLDVDKPHKIIVVTSSMPGEGKTTSVANLATALASSGQRVLAIEADLRRPKLADLLGMERSVGLTSILSGRVRLEQAVQHWSGGLFDVLTSGPLPPNPSELLASQQMALLLGELRQRYDIVLLDAPPLLPVADPAAVAPSTDGALIVCKFKMTRSSQIQAAVQAIEAVSVPVLGTIFTMVPKSGPRAYAQYNSYYRAEQPEVPAEVAVGKVRSLPRPRTDVQTQRPQPVRRRN